MKYPALPQPAGTAAPVASFEPSAQLTPLPLSCRPAELAIANAVDDDCNGLIDDGVVPSESERPPLLLALAYPQTAAVKLTLKSMDKTLELNAESCSAEQSFCTLRLPAATLLHGDSTLLADGTALDASKPAPSVLVSLQTRDKVTTYVAPVAVGAQGQALGKLYVP